MLLVVTAFSLLAFRRGVVYVHSVAVDELQVWDSFAHFLLRKWRSGEGEVTCFLFEADGL